MQAFAGTLGTWVHAGLTPATPNHNYMEGLQYGNDPNLATDAANRTVMAWYSNATGRLGVLAQDVNADGSPGRRPAHDAGHGRDERRHARPHAVGRARGGGFYVAYPTPGSVRVWRVGASSAPVVAGIDNSPAVAVAAAGDGRIWVLWTKGFGDPDVLARRSNKGATRFGATVNAGHPKDADAGLQARRERRGQRARRARQLQHRRRRRTRSRPTAGCCPASRCKASPGRLRKGEQTQVRFTVLDAGDPVSGARVKVAGRSGTTDGSGRVTLSLKSRRALEARATRSGYTAATRRIGVRG